MGILLKKRYGQHFLRDTGVITRIISLIQPEATDLMAEIGAGDGSLSIHLAPQVLRLIALEIDRDLIPALTKGLAPYRNAEVVNIDILQADLIGLLSRYYQPGMRLRFVGNLPYNIATAIIEMLISLPLPTEDMTFMLQLETVERISALPGTKEYGFFSVFCQRYCSVIPGFRVSPACFVPRPKVLSAMLSLKPRGIARDHALENDFLTITKAAFAYRRKKLANALRRNRQIGPSADQILREAGIDGARRAEELTVEEYGRLTRIYHQSKSDRN